VLGALVGIVDLRGEPGRTVRTSLVVRWLAVARRVR
jgi:hypothetical protein